MYEYRCTTCGAYGNLEAGETVDSIRPHGGCEGTRVVRVGSQEELDLDAKLQRELYEALGVDPSTLRVIADALGLEPLTGYVCEHGVPLYPGQGGPRWVRGACSMCPVEKSAIRYRPVHSRRG